ncbi:MAG: DUF3787 domain-containing protein [Clostridia bacterium]|nr:DUF3787 domain-containing protein [Clostridia bacterium]
MMLDKRRHALPVPEKRTDDVADVIWGGVKGTFETQAISDDSGRQRGTNAAMPSDTCVKEGKDWVDSNHK